MFVDPSRRSSVSASVTSLVPEGQARTGTTESPAGSEITSRFDTGAVPAQVDGSDNVRPLFGARQVGSVQALQGPQVSLNVALEGVATLIQHSTDASGVGDVYSWQWATQDLLNQAQTLSLVLAGMGNQVSDKRVQAGLEHQAESLNEIQRNVASPENGMNFWQERAEGLKRFIDAAGDAVRKLTQYGEGQEIALGTVLEQLAYVAQNAGSPRFIPPQNQFTAIERAGRNAKTLSLAIAAVLQRFSQAVPAQSRPAFDKVADDFSKQGAWSPQAESSLFTQVGWLINRVRGAGDELQALADQLHNESAPASLTWNE